MSPTPALGSLHWLKKTFMMGSMMLLSTFSSAETLSIAMGGDVMMGNTLLFPEVPPAQFGEAKPLMQKADMTFINLEGPIGGDKAHQKACKGALCFTFSQSPAIGALLKEAGVKAVSIANNHAMDMGLSGKKMTRTVLDQYGIAYAGQPDVPWTVLTTPSKVRVGFAAFAYNQGVSNFKNLEHFTQLIRQAKQKSEVLVVSLHMGAEGKSQAIVMNNQEEVFAGEQRGNPYRLARLAIDAGADIVMGHGPHVPRGIDRYKNRLIVYSLGNFLTAKGMNIQGISGAAPLVVAQVKPSGDLVNYTIHSFRQTGSTLVNDSTHEAERLMKHLSPAY